MEKTWGCDLFFVLLMTNWLRCSVWPRGLSQKPRSQVLLCKEHPLPALWRKHRSQGTHCVFQAGGDALWPERLWEAQGAARSWSGDAQGRGTSKASAYFTRNPKTDGVFQGVDVHRPEIMKVLPLVSSLACWGTQKLGIQRSVSSSPKIINLLLDS